MEINTTQLRKNIYKILDQALHTGIPIEVERRGQLLTIVPPPRKSKLARLKKRPYLAEPLEFYDHIDWSGEWKGKKNL